MFRFCTSTTLCTPLSRLFFVFWFSQSPTAKTRAPILCDAKYAERHDSVHGCSFWGRETSSKNFNLFYPQNRWFWGRFWTFFSRKPPNDQALPYTWRVQSRSGCNPSPQNFTREQYGSVRLFKGTDLVGYDRHVYGYTRILPVSDWVNYTIVQHRQKPHQQIVLSITSEICLAARLTSSDHYNHMDVHFKQHVRLQSWAAGSWRHLNPENKH